jgi:hypothetical protein
MGRVIPTSDCMAPRIVAEKERFALGVQLCQGRQDGDRQRGPDQRLGHLHDEPAQV